jgi:hypothetical protein
LAGIFSIAGNLFDWREYFHGRVSIWRHTTHPLKRRGFNEQKHEPTNNNRNSEIGFDPEECWGLWPVHSPAVRISKQSWCISLLEAVCRSAAIHGPVGPGIQGKRTEQEKLAKE